MAFHKATKESTFARVALQGPSGSGKSYTGLIFATELAALEGKRAAALDTERGSLSLYGDEFDFDVEVAVPPFNPTKVVEAVLDAYNGGYGALFVDSLSHFWEAEGGVLDLVDRAAKEAFGGNRWSGWAVGTPAQNSLIFALTAVPIHIVVSMRSRQEWAEAMVGGRKTYTRVGTKPVQREGIEYEFTIVGELDLQHTLAVTKSRARVLADRVVSHPGPSLVREFHGWLRSGVLMATPARLAEVATALRSVPAGGREAVRRWWVDQGLGEKIDVLHLPAMTEAVADELIGSVVPAAGGRKPGDPPPEASSPEPSSPAPAGAPEPAPEPAPDPAPEASSPPEGQPAVSPTEAQAEGEPTSDEPTAWVVSCDEGHGWDWTSAVHPADPAEGAATMACPSCGGPLTHIEPAPAPETGDGPTEAATSPETPVSGDAPAPEAGSAPTPDEAPETAPAPRGRRSAGRSARG